MDGTLNDSKSRHMEEHS